MAIDSTEHQYQRVRCRYLILSLDASSPFQLLPLNPRRDGALISPTGLLTRGTPYDPIPLTLCPELLNHPNYDRCHYFGSISFILTTCRTFLQKTKLDRASDFYCILPFQSAIEYIERAPVGIFIFQVFLKVRVTVIEIGQSTLSTGLLPPETSRSYIHIPAFEKWHK